MSDNDFLFDDDKKAEPAVKSKPAGNAAVKKKPAPKSAPRPAAAPARAAGVQDQQSVTVTIAALIAVVALLIGIIVGIFVGRAMTPDTVSSQTVTGGTSMTGTAPALTEEQIQGGMPAGHPDPSAATGGSTETTTAP